MEYYAIVSQGDEIPPLSEENDGGGTRASYMLIFKVASILCCMFKQIPIPKVSFNTPHSLSTTKILSYVNMYDYTSKSPTVSNKNNIQTYVLCIKSICITYQLLDTQRGINRINADQGVWLTVYTSRYSYLPTNWPGQQFRRSIPTVVVYTHLFIYINAQGTHAYSLYGAQTGRFDTSQFDIFDQNPHINPICVINFFQRFNSLNGRIKFIIDIIVRQSKKNPNNQRYIYL